MTPRSAVSWTVALIVLLAVATMGSPVAYGACGDYLMPSRSHHGSSLFDMTASYDTLREHELNSPPTPGRNPPRCNGIHCSRQYFPSPTPVRISLPDRQVCLLLGSDVSPPQSSAKFYESESLTLPACHLARIFRPPRPHGA
jgi:hypothetical protein